MVAIICYVILLHIAKELATEIIKDTIRKALKEIVTKERFPPPSDRLQRIAEPSMISMANLYKNYRNVLNPEKVLRLEEKMSDLRKYSQTIRDDLKILIVDNISGITQQQAEQLQMKIMEYLDNYVKTNPEKIPKFLESSYTFRCLKIVCADEFTLKWLKQFIVNLSPQPWKGAQLEVTLMSSYSILSTISMKHSTKQRSKEVRVKFVIPTTIKKVEFAEVVTRLQLCNPPIKTDNWKKLKEEGVKNGTLYYVSMSNDSFEEIKNRGYRLFYLLGSIKITVLNENEVIDCRTTSESTNVKDVGETTVASKTPSQVSLVSMTSCSGCSFKSLSQGTFATAAINTPSLKSADSFFSIPSIE